MHEQPEIYKETSPTPQDVGIYDFPSVVKPIAQTKLAPELKQQLHMPIPLSTLSVSPLQAHNGQWTTGRGLQVRNIPAVPANSALSARCHSVRANTRNKLLSSLTARTRHLETESTERTHIQSVADIMEEFNLPDTPENDLSYMQYLKDMNTNLAIDLNSISSISKNSTESAIARYQSIRTKSASVASMPWVKQKVKKPVIKITKPIIKIHKPTPPLVRPYRNIKPTVTSLMIKKKLYGPRMPRKTASTIRETQVASSPRELTARNTGRSTARSRGKSTKRSRQYQDPNRFPPAQNTNDFSKLENQTYENLKILNQTIENLKSATGNGNLRTKANLLSSLKARSTEKRISVRRVNSCETLKPARDPIAIGPPVKRVLSTV